ncbi:YlxR family protein [Salininema proteolyticum]|uniref:YlxR family protein n=1 Tax=Salininema proteolyticum TaxID=1607685 RepID=A0ABV8U1Q7_9ACTN
MKQTKGAARVRSPREEVDLPVVRNARPIRTCAGCRKRTTADRLLRIVADPTSRTGGEPVRLLPDPKRRLSGRGVHVHRSGQCLELALRKRALGRALRVEGKVDAGAVRTFFDSEA